VKVLVGLGKEDLAARMGVVPPDGFSRSGFCSADAAAPPIWHGLAGKRERRPERVLAIERHIIRDHQPPLHKLSEQNPADFGAAARQRKKRIHHRQADIVQHSEEYSIVKGHSGAFHVATELSGSFSVIRLRPLYQL